MSSFQTRVGIVGLGRLGMSLANVLAKNGAYVVGHDVNVEAEKDCIRQGLLACTGVRNMADCEAIFVIVNTTFKDEYRYDNLEAALFEIAAHTTKRSPLIVICSTCSPDFFQTSLGFAALRDNTVYSPFFVRQGLLEHDILNPDFSLIGDDSENYRLADRLQELYRQLLGIGEYRVMGVISASITKMAINGFLTMKIAYANMIGDLCTDLCAEPDVVLAAVGSDHRINPHCMKYGDGFGGPCLPIDTKALADTLLSRGFSSEMPTAAHDTNDAHLFYQLRQFIATNTLKSEPVLFTGLAFKDGTDIITHSQRLLLAVQIANLGWKVYLSDTNAVLSQIKAIHGDLFHYEATDH